MLNTRNKHPIRVGVLDISAQNKTLLEFFFSDSGKSYFKETDSPSTIWVAKPLTVETLMDASIAIKEMIETENSIKENLIAPVEKKQEDQEETIKDIYQYKNTPIETIEQESIQDTITTTYQVEDKKIIAITEEKPELVITRTTTPLADLSDSSDLIDKDHGLNAPDLFLEDEDISAIPPLNKTEIDKSTKNEDDIDALLASLISEGETDNAFLADLPKSEAVEASHSVEETTLKTSVEDLALEIATTELENDVQSSDEEGKNNDHQEVIDALVSETVDPIEADNKTDAINVINISEDKNALTSSKPPTKPDEDKLQSLLEEIMLEASGSNSTSKAQRKTYLPTTMVDKRKKLTCGENEKEQSLQSLCTITYQEHILSSLLETIEQAKETSTVFRVKFIDIIVVIDPKTDSIYCDESIFSDYYASICHAPISKNDIKIHHLDESEIRLYRNKIKAGDKNAHTTESFIWTTSLVTHQGHLPVATDINKKIGLKYWPNLTRLESLPHAIQIAAIFHKCPKSLFEITNEMDISKKYIIAFYNAVLFLDFIEQDGRKHSTTPTSIGSHPNKNRGFFSRFLNRLSA